MREFKILIPSVHDQTREQHTGYTWAQWENKLFRTCGGFTRGGLVDGQWRDAELRIITDRSHVYYVGTTEDNIRRLARYACELFGQQCVYVVDVGQAWLIAPNPTDVDGNGVYSS